MTEISSKTYLIVPMAGAEIVGTIRECIQLAFTEQIDCEFKFNDKVVKINRDEIVSYINHKYYFTPKKND